MKKQNTKLDKILPQVAHWATHMLPPSGDLEEYWDGGGKVVYATIDLVSIGMLSTGQALISAQSGQWWQANQHMQKAFARLLYSDLIDVRALKGTSGTIIEDLDGITHTMLGAITMGMPELVKPFHREIFEGIAGGYGMNDGHNLPLSSTLRYAAFGLSIIGDWLGQPLDLDKHKLPRDPAWGLLVANWREPDVEKFLPILMSACDTHIERIGVTSRDFDQPEKYEFGSALLAVHPAEILAVLRLRELVGLSNPDDIPHPLMQTPYARITCRPGELTLQDELLERFLATVRLRDPHVLPPDL